MNGFYLCEELWSKSPECGMTALVFSCAFRVPNFPEDSSSFGFRSPEVAVDTKANWVYMYRPVTHNRAAADGGRSGGSVKVMGATTPITHS